MTLRILVVESKQVPTAELRSTIEADGYRVLIVASEEIVAPFESQRELDVLLVDWTSSETSERALADLLRSQTQNDKAAVIIFAQQKLRGESFRGIAAGAHQCLSRPATVSELSARIKAFASGRQSPDGIDAIVAGDLRLNCKEQSVSRGERRANLSLVPFRILEFLISNPGKVYSRRQLARAVWGPESTVDERTIDVEIKRVRAALNRGNDRDPIRTVRGNGYAFDETFGRYALPERKKRRLTRILEGGTG
jgi:two-component system, OmpR family, phosphate regulon response regulator PhoB